MLSSTQITQISNLLNKTKKENIKVMFVLSTYQILIDSKRVV